MTGILVDPITFLLFTLAFLASLCRVTPFSGDIDMAYCWESFRNMTVVWSLLIILAFLPSAVLTDTSTWDWPPNRRKRVSAQAPNPNGGPPRNQWPNSMRFSYFSNRSI
tara:strand:- start:2473 stop:2799 length:327 start_codon:yes stop_codon:yes gene_type:complete